jgi:hypothetical protein
MPIISPPFTVERSEDGNSVIMYGYGVEQRKEFNRLIASSCKLGKVYQLKAVEVTASEVQSNYLHVCLAKVAYEYGETSLVIRHFFYSRALERALSGIDGNFQYEDWVLCVVNPMTGELIKEELQPMHQWNVTMMRNFIEFVQASVKEHLPNFVFPDAKQYNLPIKGRKNEPVNRNIKSEFSLI